MQTVLSKTTADGHNVTIAYADYELHVTVNGKYIGSSCVGICKLKQAQGRTTHYIPTDTINIGLTSDEADLITDRIEAICDADPRDQRAEIVSRLSSALEDIRYHSGREDGGTGLRFDDVRKARERAKDAQAELDAFDAAHPDIKAEIDSIEAKRNADAHRAVYNA